MFRRRTFPDFTPSLSAVSGIVTKQGMDSEEFTAYVTTMLTIEIARSHLNDRDFSAFMEGMRSRLAEARRDNSQGS